MKYNDIPRIPRKKKKILKKQKRYTTKKEWVENQKERLNLIR